MARGLTQLEQLLINVLRPFAEFADPSARAPDTLQISVGSSLARKQLTMGDCYRAQAAIESAEYTAGVRS